MAILNPGDEVILPSYTFSSTATSAVLAGAKLVFVDIRPDTMNIDETKIDNLVMIVSISLLISLISTMFTLYTPN